MDDRAVLRLELARELRLRALERVALDDRRDLLLEPFDEPVERPDEGRTCPGGQGQRQRGLGVVEVVDVDDVAAPWVASSRTAIA